MKIEDFNKLLEFEKKELVLNEENILDKSIQLSNLYIYFMQLYTKELSILKNKFHEKDKIYGERYHHYKFKYDFQLDTKNEIDSYVKADPTYYDIALKYSQQETQVKHLEQTLELINNLGFRIKNYVDLKKLSKGLL